MKTKIIKSQKPISLDVHLKYECPECKCDHWLFLREAQTQNFKIVCECGVIFKPKTIDNIKVIYKQKNRSEVTNSIPEVKNDLIMQAVPYLVNLGFTKEESLDMLKKVHTKQPTDDLSVLIKNTLLELRNNG